MLKYGFAFTIIIFFCLTLTNCLSDDSSESKMNLLGSMPSGEIKNPDLNKQSGSNSEQPSDGIPNWYLRNRVQVHTALFARDIDSQYFFNFPKKLAQQGAKVLIRQIKSHDEEPWWPSKYGTVFPPAKKFINGNENLAQEIISETHNLNMKSIIYYRHQEDSEMLSKHPDWACKDIYGKNIKSKRGTYLSLSSPYRDVVIQRVLELATYGADGIYFDEIHIPINGDFSKYANQNYKNIYGTDLVNDFKAGKIQNFYDFRNKTILNFFTDLKRTLNNAGLNPLIIVSGNSWPTLTDLHMNSTFFKDFTLKSELEVPNRIFKGRAFTMPMTIKQEIPSFYLNAFTFSFMRDNSFGPPEIWCPDIKSKTEAENISAGLISLGCIADVNIRPKNPNFKTFSSILSWNNTYGEIFEKLKPYAQIGITVSEAERNQFLKRPGLAWKNVLLPAYESFETLYKIGAPIKLLSDAQLTPPNNLNNLRFILTNSNNKSLANKLTKEKIIDFKELDSINIENQLMKLGLTIFCKKSNEYVHVNYFYDDNKNIYIVVASDFNSVKKNFTNSSKTNLVYTKSLNYKSKKTIQLYIKKESIEGNLFNAVKRLEVQPEKNNKNGFVTYNIDLNQPLNIYTFKSNF